MGTRERWQGLQAWSQAAAVAAGYLALALLTTALTAREDDLLVFWPGAGLAVAALCGTQHARWPHVAGAIGAASLVFSLLEGHAIEDAVGLAAADVLAPVVGVAATQAILGVELPDLARLRHLAGTLAGAAVAGSAAGAVVAGAVLAAGGEARFGPVVGSWFMSNCTGLLLVAPIGICALDERRPKLLDRQWESVATITFAVVVAAAAFRLTDRPVLALVMVPVIVAALRLGVCGAGLAMAGVGTAVLGLTARGYGVYADDASSTGNAVLVAQAALIVSSAIATTVGSLTVERAEERERRRRQEEELGRLRRLETLGAIAASLAHDVNNLLGVIRGHAERARDEVARGGDPGPALERIGRAVDSGTDLARRMAGFHADEARRRAPVELNEVVRDMHGLLHRVLGERVRLALELDPAAGVVLADHTQLERALLNLVVNAADAMPGGGELTLSTGVDGDRATLAVADTGVGMDAATVAAATRRGFTTKPTGTGLGLATVLDIAREHEGDLRIESAPGRGTTVRLELPRAPDAAPPDAAPALAGGETILLADDNEQVRFLVTAALEDAGYRLLEARDGEEALRVLAERGGGIDLLITDVGMPGMDGVELHRRLREQGNETPVLFITGAPEEVGTPGGPPAASVLAKPFTLVELAARVRAMLDAAPARHAA